MKNKAHQLISYKDGERTRLCCIGARHVSRIETPSMIQRENTKYGKRTSYSSPLARSLNHAITALSEFNLYQNRSIDATRERIMTALLYGFNK